MVDPDHDGDTDTLATEDQIIALCRRTLRALPLPLEGVDVPRTPRAPPGSRGEYSGLTSQGAEVRFQVRDERMRGFQLGVRYQCSDGTSPFRRGDPLRLKPDDEEELGPFPAMRLGPGRLQRAFETPSQTAVYELDGSFSGGVWSGAFRAIEGWTVVGELIEPGRIITDGPDPDGGFLCDTGPITFTANRLAVEVGATGALARPSLRRSSVPTATFRRGPGHPARFRP